MIRSSLSLSTHLLPASSPSIEPIEASQMGYILPAQALLSLQKTLTPLSLAWYILFIYWISVGQNVTFSRKVFVYPGCTLAS